MAVCVVVCVYVWFWQMSWFDMVSESGVIPADMKLKITYNDLESTDASSKCAPSPCARMQKHTIPPSIWKFHTLTHREAVCIKLNK